MSLTARRILSRMCIFKTLSMTLEIPACAIASIEGWWQDVFCPIWYSWKNGRRCISFLCLKVSSGWESFYKTVLWRSMWPRLHWWEQRADRHVSFGCRSCIFDDPSRKKRRRQLATLGWQGILHLWRILVVRDTLTCWKARQTKKSKFLVAFGAPALSTI